MPDKLLTLRPADTEEKNEGFDIDVAGNWNNRDLGVGQEKKKRW